MTKPGCAFRTSVTCETNGFGSNANRAAARAARRSLTNVSRAAGVCVAPAHAIRLCFQNPASSRTSSNGRTRTLAAAAFSSSSRSGSQSPRNASVMWIESPRVARPPATR